MNEWKDPFEEEPPRHEEILFMTGDEKIHLGEIFSDEKLRKAPFRSFFYRTEFFCDTKEELEDRVIYWHPLPTLPRS